MKKIEIILTEPFRTNAARALSATGRLGEHGIKSFPGPTFLDSKAKISAGAVEVTVPNGDIYIYPYHTVARVKVSDVKDQGAES